MKKTLLILFLLSAAFAMVMLGRAILFASRCFALEGKPEWFACHAVSGDAHTLALIGIVFMLGISAIARAVKRSVK